MHIREYLEVIAAIHLSSRVSSNFPERGGLMIVGPPAVLKSSMLQVLDRHYHDVLTLSDINAKTLTALRDAVSSHRINSLVFPEFGKIYQRKSDTSSNVEGVLTAMVSEGFLSAGFEDSRIQRLEARAVVIGAMVPATHRKHFEEWEDSGFHRRFLWSYIVMEHPGWLEAAVVEAERLSFGLTVLPRAPVDGSMITDLTTRAERERCRVFVKYQPGGHAVLQLQLLTKALAVLRWWYRESGDPRNAMDTITAFGETLGKIGGRLDFDLPRKLSPQKQTAERTRADKSERTAAARRLATGRKTKARNHK